MKFSIWQDSILLICTVLLGGGEEFAKRRTHCIVMISVISSNQSNGSSQYIENVSYGTLVNLVRTNLVVQKLHLIVLGMI